MKLSFALPSKAKQAEPAPLKKPAAFSALDDDETTQSTSKLLDTKDAAVNKQLLARNVEYSKAMKKRMEAEESINATVYQYDEVWDRMQEAKVRQQAVKEMEAKERKPKYISELLNSAATRRLDYLRAEEKMIQREREAEGDEFKDKEAFVTQAYKDQMAEVRRAEAEEKAREEMEKKKKKGNTGMAHFYRKLLEESEQQHEQAMAAASGAPKVVMGPQGPMPNLTITKPLDFTPQSDLELARIAREQGKDVELNDDNQIVDKRDLLSAGLNLSAPNTRQYGLQKPGGATKAKEEVEAHRAVGTAASRKEINQRRAKEILQQITEEEERQMKEKARQEAEATERLVMKRNTEEDVQSARERYLQRKRQRLDDAAAGAGYSITPVSGVQDPS